MLVRVVPLLLLLVACGDRAIKIDACASGADSTLECQTCCAMEGCDPDRANYTPNLRRGCTCYLPEGVELSDTDEATCAG